MSVNEYALEKNNFTNYDLLVSIYDSGIAKLFALKSSSFCVLTGLCRYYNHKNGVVFPSIETLASKLNLSEKTVRTAIKELENKSLILRTKKRSHNVYCFTNLFWDYIKELAVKSNKITGQSGKFGIKSPVNFTCKQNKDKQNKLTSSCKKNDDILKNSKKTAIDYPAQNIAHLNTDQDNKNTEEIKDSQFESTEDNFAGLNYKQIIESLLEYGFQGGKEFINKHGLEKTQLLVKYANKNEDINNKGAYIRQIANKTESEILELINKKADKQVEGINYPDAEEVQKALKESVFHGKDSCPLDFNRDEALTWCKNLPKILKIRSNYYAQLKIKWDFTDQELNA